MTLKAYLATASVALCIPATALAAGHGSAGHSSTNVNCGGSGVNSLYCIPQKSVFAFAHIAKVARCSMKVGFTVEPKIKGLSGNAHITVKGVGPKNGHVTTTARPAVGAGGGLSHVFAKLLAGPYQLTGWYEGDGTRLASTHVTKRFTLKCH